MIFGRDEAWHALDKVVFPTDRLGSTLLLRGSAGTGKSALLAEAGALWHRRGVRVISLPAADGCLLDQLRDTARALLAGHSEPGLLDSVRAVVRSGHTEENALPLVHELTRALARLASRRPTALVVEDVDRAEPALQHALSLLVQGARAAGSAVLVSSRSPTVGDLDVLADHVWDLPDLAEADVVSLIGRWGGRKAVDPTLTSALSAALGPLHGNPGTLLSTLRALRTDERLVTLDGNLCLLHPNEPIVLAEEHELLRAVRDRGIAAERLVAAIAELAGPTVDELPRIAEALGVNRHATGDLLDQLITTGTLYVDQHERLSPSVPALGSALLRDNDERVHDLRSTLTWRLLQRAAAGEPVDRADLANQLVRTDPHVSCPIAVDLLLDQADRVQRTEPGRAADYYRAAAARLPNEDHRRPRTLRTAVRFQLRLGRYGQLADDLAGIARTCGTAHTDAGDAGPLGPLAGGVLVELASCWVVALLHEERITEFQHVQHLFTCSLNSPASRADPAEERCTRTSGIVNAAITLLDQLIAEHGPPHRPPSLARVVVDVLRLIESLEGDHETFQHAWERWERRSPLPLPDPEALREAGTVADHTTVLELLLGSGYGRPHSGSLITYQRLVRAYLSGDWDTALSAARAMVTDGSATRSPARTLSRAFAAEMCVVRGELQRAGEWLTGVSDDVPGGHLVSWAWTALRYFAGDPATAVDQGWQDYLRHRDTGRLAGLERLLGRLTMYAHQLGETGRAREMLAELSALHERTRTPAGREVLLMMTGLLDADPTPITDSIKLAQQRGDLFRVLAGCLFNGALAAEPEPWLREAYSLGKQLGSPSTRSAAGDRMRELGVPVPRSRSPRAAFSDTELRIIGLVADGFTNRKIATNVGISEKTVESHLTRLLARTGCRSRVELTAAHLEGKLLGASA